MAGMFIPMEETPEGWRRTILGTIACFVGWHFGQIARNERVICANCFKMYKSNYTVPDIHNFNYLLPKRTILLLKEGHGEITDKFQLSAEFECYKCVDCFKEFTSHIDIILHQDEWHGWRSAWKRLKES